jgi:hypothetical protein
MRSLPVTAVCAVVLLAAPVLAPGPAAAYESPPDGLVVTEPVAHKVKDEKWRLAGRYTAGGGPVSLRLVAPRYGVETFVEECDGADLGRVRFFPGGETTTWTYASKVKAGTCLELFMHALHPHEPYTAKGTVTY